MEHLAIMRKSWGLLPRILRGEKKIESRWLKSKRAPWNSVREGEKIYFKDSGEDVSLVARAGRVIQLELKEGDVPKVLKKYGRDDGIHKSEFPFFEAELKHKKFCVLIELIAPRKIEPFRINKKGFGAMAAWISVPRISSLKEVE